MSFGSGAASGAAMGSAVPGIGTIAGGLIGGIGGLFGGGDDGRKPVGAGVDMGGGRGNMGGDAGYVGSDGLTPEQRARLASNDPNARNAWAFGGTNGSAAALAGGYEGQAANYANLRSPGIDYGQANGYMGMGDAARGSQTDALAMMQAAAQGNAPSQAALQMRQGNDQAMASQLAMAAGARGPAALAQAQYNAAGNNAAMNNQNIANTGMLRAQEMAGARNAYMQGASGIRGQDLGYANLGSQNAQAQGQLGLGYRQLGQQGQLGYDQLAWNTRNAEMGGAMGQQGFNLKQAQGRSDTDASSRDASASNVKYGITTGIGVMKDIKSGAL